MYDNKKKLMKIYIAFMRGINVGGNRSMKMNELKQLLEKLGFSAIQTYIQSGNVVFQTAITDVKKIENMISNGIKDRFKYEVPVLVLDQIEFIKIIDENPFILDDLKDLSHLHVTFLSDVPRMETYTEIKYLDYKPDEFQLVNRAVYLYCPLNYSKSKLTNGFFEKKLGVEATTRNWKTVTVLLDMIGND